MGTLWVEAGNPSELSGHTLMVIRRMAQVPGLRLGTCGEFADGRDMRRLSRLRIAGGDAQSVENVLAGEVPVDELQHAGDALLRAGHSEGLVKVAGSLIEALAQRGWTGDPELINEYRNAA